MKQPMKRVNLYLPEEQLQQLSEIHSETGAPVSEIVRRAITNYVGAWHGRQEGRKDPKEKTQDR